MFTRACETTCQGAQGDWIVLSISVKLYLLFFIYSIRRFLLAPIPWLILHNQQALTLCGRCEQYTINFRGIFDWKRGIDQPFLQAQRPSCVLTSELKKKRSRLSENEINELLTETERKESKNT